MDMLLIFVLCAVVLVVLDFETYDKPRRDARRRNEADYLRRHQAHRAR